MLYLWYNAMSMEREKHDIGRREEPPDSPLLEELRRRLGKVGMLAMLTGALVMGTVAKTADDDTIEVANLSTEALLAKLFKNEPKITPPGGEYNRSQIEMWRKRYAGKDANWDENTVDNQKKKSRRQETARASLLRGWEKLKQENKLQIVYKACRKHHIPFDVIFLMLAESHGHKGAQSIANAGGYWQFIPKTALGYGLRVGTYVEGVDQPAVEVDERRDFAKSTDAAVRLLKDLYKMTYAWDGDEVPPTIDYKDEDRWAYAFWAYNRSPKHVSDDYKACDGDASLYAERLKDRIPESSGYVSKIHGIRAALTEYEENGDYSEGQSAIEAYNNAIAAAAQAKTKVVGVVKKPDTIKRKTEKKKEAGVIKKTKHKNNHTKKNHSEKHHKAHTPRVESHKKRDVGHRATKRRKK